MLISSKFILTAFAVLYISTGLTNAALTNQGSKKDFTIDERIQFTDQLSELAVKEALKIINETAKASVSIGADKNAVNFCEESIKIGFDLLASCRQVLNAAFIKAHTLATKDPAVAAETLSKTVNEITDYIFVAAVPVQTLQGRALAIVGELARPGLRTAIKLLQHCGVVLFKSLNFAEKLATTGIKAGPMASDQALVAANEIFNAGEEAIYKLLVESALSAFEGLKAAAGKAPVRDFTSKNLNNTISKETPEAQIVIDQLTVLIKEALNDVSQEPAIEALNTIYQNFLSSIFQNAKVIVKAYRAIDATEKLIGSDPEVAVAALHKELLAVDDAILAVSADALLGLGMGGHIAGEKVIEGLIPAVVTISEGRVNLYNDLILAEEIATAGLRGGDGAAALQGLKAARACISVASNGFFTHFIDAIQKVLRVLKAC